MRPSHPSTRRNRRARTAVAGLVTAAVVAGTAGITSAGAPPEDGLALSNVGCELTIEASVAGAGMYEVIVYDSSMVQETFPIDASGGSGTFTFIFIDAPNPPPSEEFPPFPVVELRVAGGALLVGDSHRLDGCVGSAITTTTSVPVEETTTTDTTSPPSTAPGGTVPEAVGAEVIAGSANYTG